MSDAVRTELAEGIASIGIDDGKANALGPAVIAGLFAALDGAEQEARAVVLAGRPGRFSAIRDTLAADTAALLPDA